MKFLLALFGLLVSANVYAATGGEVCKFMADNYQNAKANECIQIIAGGYFQPDATDICMNVAKNYQYTQANSCLQEIKNKAFSDVSALQICKTMVANYQYQQGLTCLKNLGVAGYQPGQLNRYYVLQQLDLIYDQLVYGNVNNAVTTLLMLKSYIQNN